MSRYIPFLYSSLLLGGGLVFFFLGFRTLKRKRLIEDTPTAKARSVAVGRAELSGTGQPLPGARIVAPFTGRECAYVSWKIEREVRSGKSSHWDTIKKGHTGPFLIRDETGAALVVPDGADVELRNDVVAKSGAFRDPSPAVREFLAREHVDWEGMLGMNYTMRYSETALVAGGPAYVLGAARQDAVAKKLFDEGTAATALAIGPDEQDGAFYLSDTEKDLTGRLRGQLAAQLLGGAAASVIGLVMLMNDFGVR